MAVTITTGANTAHLILDTLDNQRRTTLNQLGSAVLNSPDDTERHQRLAVTADALLTARAAVQRGINSAALTSRIVTSAEAAAVADFAYAADHA